MTVEPRAEDRKFWATHVNKKDHKFITLLRIRSNREKALFEKKMTRKIAFCKLAGIWNQIVLRVEVANPNCLIDGTWRVKYC